MAILSNSNLGFILTFHYDNYPEHDYHIYQFTDQEDELSSISDAETLNLKENLPISLKFFTDNASDRIYIEGMDTVEQAKFDEDGNAYFSSSEDYQFFLSEFQLIPGSYPLHLTYKGKIYYSRFILRSSVMEQSTWTQLCNEVDSFVHGLAEQFILSKHGQKYDESTDNHNIDFNLYNQFIFLQKTSSSFLNALDNINRNTKFEIHETHELVLPGKAHRTDMQTIRHQQRYGNAPHRLYVPKKVITYDIPANRLLKSDLIVLHNILIELETMGQAIIAEYQQALKDEMHFLNNNQKLNHNTRQNEQLINDYKVNIASLKEGVHIAQNIQLRIYKLFNSSWFKQIVDMPISPASISHSLLDPRYATIHELVNTLSNSRFKLTLSPSYQLQFKRSNKLYEIWCFIRIHKILMDELGFDVQSGWIYENGAMQKLIIPLLRSGEQLVYLKDSLELHLTYDAVLPDRPEFATLMKTPLYLTYKHRRPDIRLDAYYKGHFAGTIIFDAKYRKASSILRYRNDVLEQIRDYSNAGSQFYLKDFTLFAAYKPVQEVILMLPNKDTSQAISADTNGISILNEIPGDESSPCTPIIKKHLKNMKNHIDFLSKMQSNLEL